MHIICLETELNQTKERKRVNPSNQFVATRLIHIVKAETYVIHFSTRE
jgi:hypothetical protein